MTTKDPGTTTEISAKAATTSTATTPATAKGQW
jgi:hypothetical protein